MKMEGGLRNYFPRLRVFELCKNTRRLWGIGGKQEIKISTPEMYFFSVLTSSEERWSWRKKKRQGDQHYKARGNTKPHSQSIKDAFAREVDSDRGEDVGGARVGRKSNLFLKRCWRKEKAYKVG